MFIQFMATSEIPLSHTKIILPALRPEILHRRRLLSLFDDLLDKKLILVIAPAGYGKTSLLVDFSRQSRMPICWLSLDDLDKDPQRFYAYLIGAIEQRFPRFGNQSKSVLKSLTGLEEDTERLLAVIVNEIDSLIDEHFTLVVDDYHFVDAVPAIRNMFSRFIYMAGENCHVILSSRRLPALPDIAIMVARQQVGGFDLEQLAFRPNEIRSLFEMNYGVSLSENTLEELMRQTEGWITGLHLSASSTTHGVPDLTQAARTAGVDLAVYLDEQILSQQPPDLRLFLLKTSLLEEFDQAFCEAVLGKGDWTSLIKTVRQNNLFVLPVGKDGKWLRYHHLFQEFLQGKLEEEEPETAALILARLADFYKEQHDWEKAYAIYNRSGDPNQMADLFEFAGTQMLLNEHLITLRNWLDGLPLALLEARPTLLSLKGALFCALGEGRYALALLEKAVTRFHETGNLAGLALAFVRRSAAYRLVGDYEKSLQNADEAIKLSEARPDLQETFAEAERFKGICLNHMGHLNEAILVQKDALFRYEQLGEEQSVTRLQVELGMTYRASGNYRAAMAFYEQALSAYRRENNYFSQARVLNSLAVLYHYQGEYEPAVRAIEAGLKCARQIGALVQESLLLASLGDIYADLDEYEPAKRAYSNALEIAHQINFQFLTNYLGLVMARLCRLRCQINEAFHHLYVVDEFIRISGSNHESGLFYLESGCLHLEKENPAAAIKDLEKAFEHFQSGGFTVEADWSRIWLAAANFKSREVAVGRTWLKAALALDPEPAGFHPFFPALRQARPWLASYQSDVEVGPLLNTWLGRVAQVERRFPTLHKHLRRILTTIPIQAPRLHIQAFGKARVRVNEKWVTSAQWRTTSVRELFFYILAASRPLSKEEIGDTLWPDICDDQLKLRFKNELYRLRHALGQEVILYENNLYHFNHFLDYEYDVENFSAHLAKAKDARQPEDRISQLRIAASSRIGPYLQDLNATWVLAERERLDRACIAALKDLAEAHRQMGNLPAALQSCQAALQIDACREDVHRLAMQLHAEQGNQLAVIWQYQDCRNTLHTELDVAPSEETEDLYRRLTA